MLNQHTKAVCQFGFVHAQCRCPSNDKREVRVECDRVQDHAPSDPSGSVVSLKHASFDAMASGLSRANLMLSYDRREALARAIAHLTDCTTHEHHFAGLMDSRKLLLSQVAFQCLRDAQLLEF